MPELTSGSVQQLLEVLDHTSRNHKRGILLPTAYHDAVRDVSNRHRVTYQTIGDLCRRRLALSDIGQFMDLLGRWLRGDSEPLRRKIKHQSGPNAHQAIDRFFTKGTLLPGAPSPVGEQFTKPETRISTDLAPPSQAQELRLILPPEVAKRLQLAHMAGLGSSLEATALALLAKGFEAEKDRIRQLLHTAVGAT